MFSATRHLNYSVPRVKNMLDVCVVGAGGVGTIAAYVLEKSQRARVTAILRSNYAHVKERGFDIDSIDHGKVTNWRPNNVVSSFASAAAEKKSYDYIVITTKALPDLTSSVIAEIKPLMTPGKTSLALLPKRTGHRGPLRRRLPSYAHLVEYVSKIGAHFHHVDDTFTRAMQHDAAALYVDVYNAGLAAAKPKTNARCLLVDDIVGARWSNLLWNASFNTICTVLRIPVGELLSGPGRNTLLEPAMREVAAVATAAGYSNAVSEDMIQTMLHDSAPTSTFRPSMLVDLENQRPLELEVILGALLTVANEKGVSTPILTQVYALLTQVQWKLTEKAAK
ncbi:hypothetical protein MY10362_009257 [Beauveria mimosiformis]